MKRYLHCFLIPLPACLVPSVVGREELTFLPPEIPKAHRQQKRLFGKGQRIQLTQGEDCGQFRLNLGMENMTEYPIVHF